MTFYRCLQYATCAVMLLLIGAAAVPTHGQQVEIQDTQIQYNKGQPVAPIYEGYIRNPDGTIDMWFGYLNRNYEETLNIPVGPDNNIQPGGPDRGQPSVFVPRRRRGGAVARRENYVFRVSLPADFAPEQEVVWTVTAHGKTDRAVGRLIDLYALDPPTNGNTPPTVRLSLESSQITVTDSIMLTATVSDDGLPLNQRDRANIRWEHYRGAGTVTLNPSQSSFPEDADGVSDAALSTTATFSEPGRFVLRAVANDGEINPAGYPRIPSTSHASVTVEVRPD